MSTQTVIIEVEQVRCDLCRKIVAVSDIDILAKAGWSIEEVGPLKAPIKMHLCPLCRHALYGGWGDPWPWPDKEDDNERWEDYKDYDEDYKGVQ